MSDHALEFIDVSKSYGRSLALDRVSVRIGVGPHTAILGPSGSGKSTLLRLLAGLDAPTAGSILLDGQTISTAERILRPPHQRGVAMVFQDLALWPNLTARENIRLGLAGLRLSRHELSARIQDALNLCGIAELAERRPSQLSGGQQQRTALARAVAVQPRFLVLDEPFSGVDLVTKSRILNEIAMLARELQFQVILVSHDPWEAAQLCGYVMVLERGRVRQAGTLKSVFDEPACEFVRAIRELSPETSFGDSASK